MTKTGWVATLCLATGCASVSADETMHAATAHNKIASLQLPAGHFVRFSGADWNFYICFTNIPSSSEMLANVTNIAIGVLGPACSDGIRLLGKLLMPWLPAHVNGNRK